MSTKSFGFCHMKKKQQHIYIFPDEILAASAPGYMIVIGLKSGKKLNKNSVELDCVTSFG